MDPTKTRDELTCRSCGGTGEEGECYLDGPNVVTFSDGAVCRRCRGTGSLLCIECGQPATHVSCEALCDRHRCKECAATDDKSARPAFRAAAWLARSVA